MKRNKQKCKECKNNYKILTKENLCAYCYYRRKGKWPLEFSNYKKDKEGKLSSRDAPMKFKKEKIRRKIKKTKGLGKKKK